MLAPRAEADRKRSAGERCGPQPDILQRLSITVANVLKGVDEVEIRGLAGACALAVFLLAAAVSPSVNLPGIHAPHPATSSRSGD